MLVKVIKNYGLVIYESNNGGSSKFVSILLKDYGKIRVFVRGGKKLNNKLFACSQIFCCCEFVISQDDRNNQGTYVLTEANLLENFLPSSYINFCYASYFCELVDKFLLDGHLADNVLVLLIKSLKAINSLGKDPNYNYYIFYIARIFEFKFMKINGFEPEIDFCHVCNKIINKDQLFFDIYGLVCKNCLDKKKPFCKLSEYSLLILGNILKLRFNDLLDFNLDLKNIFWLKELNSAIRIFMGFNLDLKLNSKKFICEIENY